MQAAPSEASVPPRNPSTTAADAVDLNAPSVYFAIPSIAPSASASSRTRKRRADDSTSVSPTKRSRTSNSTGFGAEVKSKLGRLYGERCWHCQALLPEMAHVFAKADKAFATCQQLGLVDLEYVDDADNALSLCPLCHAAFDYDTPLLIVVPFDLQYFIDMERDWQRLFPTAPCQRPPLAAGYRDHCFQCSPSSYRAIPSHDPNTDEDDNDGLGGLYNCHMVNYYLAAFAEDAPHPPYRQLRRTRIWHGDPKAMIWRAKKKINSIPALPEHLDRVKEQLMELSLLYDKGDRLLRPYTASQLPPSYPKPGDDDERSTRLPSLVQPPYHSLPDPHGATFAPKATTRSHFDGHNQASPSRAPMTQDFRDAAAPLDPASTRKRRRESSVRLPTPTSIEAHTEEDTPTKRRKLEPLTAVAPSPSASPPKRPHQRLWRWGGPGWTTADTVEYWRNIFGRSRETQDVP